MPATARTTLLLALLCLPLPTLATTVQHCEDAQGNITFTSQGCPSGHSLLLQSTYSAPSGNATHLLPESAPSSRQVLAPQDNRRAHKELVVVGQRDDGCENQVSSEQRRRAIINQRVRAGMSFRDVESSLGTPDKIAERNGETRYHYSEKKGRSNQVVFDENGCVKGKRQKAKSPH